MGLATLGDIYIQWAEDHPQQGVSKPTRSYGYRGRVSRQPSKKRRVLMPLSSPAAVEDVSLAVLAIFGEARSASSSARAVTRPKPTLEQLEAGWGGAMFSNAYNAKRSIFSSKRRDGE